MRTGTARELIVFLSKIATAERTEQAGPLAEALCFHKNLKYNILREICQPTQEIP